MKRKDGYYWVNFRGTWIIGFWEISRWHCAEISGRWDDVDFQQIDEKQILKS